MNKKNLILDFQERNLIAQITNQKILEKQLNSKYITLYCGFDPTADSLHIGHIIPLLCLKRFQFFGHRPIVVLGGATGLVGDPSFKTRERQCNSYEIIEQWIKKIKKQIFLFLDFNDKPNSAIVINNYNWLSSINLLKFLRDIGKYFPVNKMINKESIKERLKKNNFGISFTEFTYNLLQSYDFAYLYKHYDTILQIGGSDQWGNIISGIDLTRKLYKQNVYGLTFPLITRSNNIKFGKTEKNTIWLDKNKTTPYEFYQFWINTDDNSVYRFLKFFTFLDTVTIDNLELENKKSNNTLRHQKILAKKMTYLIHGKQALETAQNITKNLFENEISKFTIKDFIQLEYEGIPTIKLQKEKIMNIQKILVDTKLASSKYNARTLIQSRSIMINKKRKIKEEKYLFHSTDRLYDRYTLLQKGKKYFCLIHWS